MVEQILYNTRVVAALFDCTVATINRACRDGRIPCMNLGTINCPRWRIPLSFLVKAMRGEARWKYPRFVRRRFKHGPAKAAEYVSRVAAKVKEFDELALLNEEDDDE